LQFIYIVMNAWIRSGDIRRAECILDKMEKAFQQGTGDVLPTVVSYSTIMNG
jgi:pentatricopeptide repeat protein